MALWCCNKHRLLIHNLCSRLFTTFHPLQSPTLTTQTHYHNHQDSFDGELSQRRKQARNSVLIHHEDRNTTETDILELCERYGKIKHCFSYCNPGVYSVVEYETRSQVKELLRAVKFPPENNGKPIPLQSRLLDFGWKSSQVVKKKSHTQPQLLQVIPHDQLMGIICEQPQTVEEQMLLLVEQHHLQDNNIRLRYLVCSLVEEAVGRVLPNSLLLKPFGSTVNLLGRRDGDLDISLDFISKIYSGQDSSLNLFFKVNKHSTERALIQSTLASLANYLQDFVPGCVGVQRILNARCPLVKFVHLPSGLCCDLTGSNKQAIKSSELLNLYARLDPRFTPLVMTLRYWAKIRSLTHSNPGPWLSSFSITSLVIFFMQSKTILPSVDKLKSVASETDKVIVEGHDCTISSSLSSVPSTENNSNLSQLLLEFFEFYGKMDFRLNALCLRTGQTVAKPRDGRPLYIHNPFNKEHNISQNVNQSQLDRLTQEIQNALWVTALPEYDRAGDNWGLATLFINSAEMSKKNPKAPRLKTLLGDLVQTLNKQQDGNKQTKSTDEKKHVLPEQINYKISSNKTKTKSGVYLKNTTELKSVVSNNTTTTTTELMETVLQSYTVDLPKYQTNTEENLTKQRSPSYYLRYSVGMENIKQTQEMNLPLMFMNGIRMRPSPRKKTLKNSMIKDLQRKLQTIAASLMS